jgi:flagellar hook-basal body complex protein FliE
VTPIIDPSFLTTGAEWQIGPAQESAGSEAASSFDGILGQQIANLTELQNGAADASRALATGEATDPTAVVMAVERAQLAMQLAGQLRTKGVEALNDIFHTAV